MADFRTLSPVDGSVVAARTRATDAEVDRALAAAHAARRSWAQTPLGERIAACRVMCRALVADTSAIAEELTWQMGRPIAHSAFEMRGFEERATTMMELAPEALAEVTLPEKAGFARKIVRVPHGVVLVLAPWNYPWLTAVNAVVPALLSGNTVLLKHSEQTPLVPERWKRAADHAGFPEGVFQFLHMTHEQSARVIADARIAHVAFTGSVEGGKSIERAALGRFIGVGLELGGKDAAYVRADADLGKTAEGVADGALFNAGQSCCGIERVYVHERVYDAFLEALVPIVKGYVLGNPTDPATTLGPVVRESSAVRIRAQIDAALAAGAQRLVEPDAFPATERGPTYMAPEVLTEVTHEMGVMCEETFGPVIGVMRVKDDTETVHLVNDSRYGLTASIWTQDLDRAAELAGDMNVGTVFTNRSDYLDPLLAWVGVKDSGRGTTLSRFGFDAFTRPKSLHFRERPA